MCATALNPSYPHRLRNLTIGGNTLAWREDSGLAGLRGLTSLRIVRRSSLQV